jgi:hypothetical protein
MSNPIVWTLLALATAAPAAESPDRVIAVGDLHADLDNALAALRLAGVVDAEGRWAAGTATFVQTGDTTDRGPDSKAILALMRRLQAQAEAAGGRVVPLLGNHEVMNLVGDWRYVDPGDVAAYGGVEPRKAALGPAGQDGKWLRSLDAVTKVGDTVFAHGGVHPDQAARGIDAINADVRAAIDADPRAPVLGETGPLWFRGYVQDPESTACPLLAQALQHLGAKRMVVGHTTRRDGQIQSRCDGRLTVIDIGIADHYGAHLGVWESVGGDARAIYASGPADLEDPR